MEASTLLGAVAVGLQLWRQDQGDVVLQWANDAAPAAELGERAARAALAGEHVDGLENGFRVRARRVDATGAVVTFEDAGGAEHLSASIIASLQEGLIVIDLSGRVTRANHAAADLYGMSLGELVGSALRDLPLTISRPDGTPLDPARSPVRRALAGEVVRGAVVRVCRRDGSALWVEVNSSPVTEPDGRPYGALSTYVDVTGRVERERRIRREAETDELTGLPNRRSLQRTLDAALARAASREGAVGVLMIDLDGFKAINDRLGHAAGDAALRDVASRLRRSVRDRDLVARSGGDEFVVVLPDLLPGEGAAHECAERIAAAFAEPLRLGGDPLTLRAAVGVACFPEDAGTAGALLEAADRAMYARKGG